MNNRQLYPGLLHELARASRLDTGRACLLTHDHKCMLQVCSISFFLRVITPYSAHNSSILAKRLIAKIISKQTFCVELDIKSELS